MAQVVAQADADHQHTAQHGERQQCLVDIPALPVDLDTHFEIRNGPLNVRLGNLAGTVCKRSQQGFVGQQMDGPRPPVRSPHQKAQSTGLKQVAPQPASQAQAVVNVGTSVVAIQRGEIEAVYHPVAHLAQFGQSQQFIQLRLAKQHNLQQLALLGFEIGEQLDFFQRLGRHGLRFVNQHHHPATLRMPLHERILDGQECGPVCRGGQAPVGQQ